MDAIYGTKEHQDLVMEVLDSEHTNYFDKWECYASTFFWLKDPESFPQRIEDKDLEVFTDKIRIAAAKYLEMKWGLPK